jgi:exonuclease SbcC
MEVKADYRQRLQHALRDKQAQDAAQMKTSDLLQQMTDKQQLLTIEKLRESELNRQLNNNQSLLMTLLHAVKGNALIHSQTELGLENLILGVTSAIEKLKQADKSREIERFALHLADQLQEQHPCPVCGSLEHPSPAFLTEASAVSISTSSELERHELLRSKAQKLQFNQVRQVMQQQALEQKLIEVLPFVSNRETAEAEAAAAISAISLDSTRFESVDSLEQEYDRITEQLKLNGYNMANLAEEMKQALQQKDHSIQQQMEALAQIQAIQTQKDGIEMQLSTAQKEYAHQQEQWKITYPMLSFDHIQLESDKLNEQDQAAEQLRLRVEQSIPFIEEVFKEIQYNMLEITELDKQKVQLETEYKGLQKQSIELQSQFKTRWEHEIKAGGTITGYIQETEQQLKQLRESERLTRQQMEISQKELFQLNEQYVTLRQAADSAQQAFMKAEQFWKEALKQTSFLTADEVKGALISSDQIEKWQQEVRQYRELSVRLTAKVEELKTKLNGQSVSETQWSEIEIMLVKARELDELALQDRAKMERDLEQLQSKHSHWCELEQNLSRHKQEFADLSKLQSVLRGNAFVEYIAEEQLIQVCRIASERLGQLTRQRYALEVDSSGGFIIRDDANGGVRRPVSTLSGGETFLTSLALALALSAQIQLSGQYPLEFFFLDEGFGTLDPELLETVVEALEKLHIDRLTVGIISHVPELKARLPRKIIVESAEPGGRGSRVIIEGL